MRQLKKDLWPCQVAIITKDEDTETSIFSWVSEKFGQFKGKWNVLHRYDHVDFYFRNSKDALMFSLRWGEYTKK